MRRAKGFTLIELLVVIAVIATLLTILVPALQQARKQAKLILCAANQRSIVSGLCMYRVENKMQLPPTIQGRTNNQNTLPNHLTYHSDRLGGDGREGGRLSKHLLDYFPDPAVFNCPLSPFTVRDDFTDEVTGTRVTYSQLYESGNSYFLYCSYWLLWNYPGFDNEYSEKRFLGPDRGRTETLVVADSLFYNEYLYPDTWVMTHPSKDAVRVPQETDKLYGGVYYMQYDMTKTMPDIWINAGYIDGHVERISAYNTVEVKIQTSYPVTLTYSYYIPEEF